MALCYLFVLKLHATRILLIGYIWQPPPSTRAQNSYIACMDACLHRNMSRFMISTKPYSSGHPCANMGWSAMFANTFTQCLYSTHPGLQGSAVPVVVLHDQFFQSSKLQIYEYLALVTWYVSMMNDPQRFGLEGWAVCFCCGNPNKVLCWQLWFSYKLTV